MSLYANQIEALETAVCNAEQDAEKCGKLYQLANNPRQKKALLDRSLHLHGKVEGLRFAIRLIKA